MTKRQLNREERALTQRNLKKTKEEQSIVQEELTMQELLYDFTLKKREFEDKIRPFQRKMELKQNEANLNMLKSKLKEMDFAVEVSEKQLKEGVDKK